MAAFLLAELAGCASPGPPRPPSLRLPDLVHTLTASRTANAITLTFKVPQRTTDGLHIRTTSVGLVVCRQLEHDPCRPVPSATTSVPLTQADGKPAEVQLADELPPALASGAPRLLAYRVALKNALGRTAGWSDPAFALAGGAPAPVVNLRARASRLGVLLEWTPDPAARGELIAERREAGASASAASAAHKGKKNAKPASELLLLSRTGATEGGRALDTSAEDDVAYIYTAYRQQTVQIGGRSLIMRGAASAPVGFTLHDIFPPPVPTDLSAAGFTEPSATGAAGAYAVDLVWQPVDDPGLAGYNIYRQPLDAAGQPSGPRIKLNAAPVPLPAFHDATAAPAVSYRWFVTSVDEKGNESAPAVFSSSRSSAR